MQSDQTRTRDKLSSRPNSMYSRGDCESPWITAPLEETSVSELVAKTEIVQ
jgi:hypothetical protein